MLGRVVTYELQHVPCVLLVCALARSLTDEIDEAKEEGLIH